MTEGRFEKCIRNMNRGDRDALKEVYEEYVSYIYGIVRQLLSTREEAEDITSEFFIRLWEKSESYRGGSGHKGWMATIARNLAIDYIRKRKREEVVDFSTERETEEGVQNFSARSAMREESKIEKSVEDQVLADISMEEALSQLKESERRVVHMKIIADMTFQEIADILEEPLGTVAWRYREAVKKLRRCGYEESGR
ncbi:MAG: RNA polymerase sigma factor [Lachnospiraceae bacterium]|nr:RNA polymerase sigma factor [Lachnospiraceae bacterium]